MNINRAADCLDRLGFYKCLKPQNVFNRRVVCLCFPHPLTKCVFTSNNYKMNARENNSPSRRHRASRKTASPAAPLSTSKRPVSHWRWFSTWRISCAPRTTEDLFYPFMRNTAWTNSYQTDTMFINGRPIVIEYNFEPSRIIMKIAYWWTWNLCRLFLVELCLQPWKNSQGFPS